MGSSIGPPGISTTSRRPGDEAAVADLRDALENALDDAGLTHRRQRDLPTFVRIEVGDGDDRL
jgi:hypothetical protein